MPYKDPNELKKNKRAYYLKNKKRIIESIMISQKSEKYKRYRIEYGKRYRVKNRERINMYYRKRKENDTQYKLKTLLRDRLNKALSGRYRAGSAVRDLGCTIDEFKIYIENKFKDGMTWKNHGIFGWHIDHRLALANFDLTNREQFLEACHYTNLQPMWYMENIKKSNKTI